MREKVDTNASATGVDPYSQEDDAHGELADQVRRVAKNVIAAAVEAAEMRALKATAISLTDKGNLHLWIADTNSARTVSLDSIVQYSIEMFDDLNAEDLQHIASRLRKAADAIEALSMEPA